MIEGLMSSVMGKEFMIFFVIERLMSLWSLVTILWSYLLVTGAYNP